MFKYIIQDEMAYVVYAGQTMILVFKGKVMLKFKNTNES